MNESEQPENTADTNNQTRADDTSIIEEYLPIDEHVEEVSEDGKQVRRKGIFLLPNLFTSAALFAGFYAIINAINGFQTFTYLTNFTKAAHNPPRISPAFCVSYGF